MLLSKNTYTCRRASAAYNGAVTCEIDRQLVSNAAGTLGANGAPTNVGGNANGNIRYDIWAMTDLILYITMDGQMSTRI